MTSLYFCIKMEILVFNLKAVYVKIDIKLCSLKHLLI